MRIFLVTPFENKLAKRGTRFIDIAEKLHAAGFEVIYITSNFSHAYKRFFSEEEMSSEKSKNGYSLYFVKIPGYRRNISLMRIYSNFIMSINFYNFLKNEIKEYDTIMVPSRPVDFLYYISKLKKIRKNIKLVMDIRDIWPDSFGKRNIAFELYCNMFLNNSVESYDRFFHISPNFVNWLNKYSKNKTSIFVPPGFNGERWKNNTQTRIKEGEIIQFVFVGSLQYQLNLLPFIKAIANNGSYSLKILGEDGRGQRYKEVSKYIAVNNVENVAILGVVEPSKVPELLKSSSIGIIPMITNSFTNKIFDYIGAYLPVLVLGNNDMGDFVQSNDIGWISSFNPNEIKDFLSSLNIHEINLKKENLVQIRNKYNRDFLYQKILDVFHQLEDEINQNQSFTINATTHTKTLQRGNGRSGNA